MTNKDSPEALAFLTVFNRLKGLVDDDPANIVPDAEKDESIRDLCADLFFAAHFADPPSARGPDTLTAPADPVFIRAWREYEADYAGPVFTAVFGDLSGLVGEDHRTLPDRRWDAADDDAREASSGIEQAMSFAQDNIDQEHRHASFPEGFVEDVTEGLKAWDKLHSETRFDLRGIFRRRALIPFVLIPRAVSAKYPDKGRHSLLTNLRQAHDAFVFGVPHASIAMMRSIMEAVLHDHYRANGSSLHAMIEDRRFSPPKAANKAALHRLRMLANSVLHLGDKQLSSGLPNLDEEGLEKEIVRLLFVLRALIEGAK
ncbi:MAG: DUF4145 domain-containing protein [Rhodobacteraceae bacterium]|nr:DUF4145 domain-containing protein [Paracoccaceae bacterium]MCC6009231.1 DUF4145 domain-containing protein [Paracoccaceae bacterium]